MPSRFLDGPAGGFEGATHRAPKYLRIVIDPHGKIDFLDELDDAPLDTEKVHVYRAVDGTIGGLMFVDGQRDGKRWGRSFQSAEYRWVALDDHFVETVCRDTEKWQAWANSDPFP